MATQFINKKYGINPTTAIADDATGRAKIQNLPSVAGIAYDSVDGFMKYNDAGTIRVAVNTDEAQTLTNKTLTAPILNAPVVVEPFTTIAGDGAVAIASGINYLTKGSAAAITVAAPGAAGIGVRITITTGTDFAHVVTFTGTTLQGGTVGANTTWTSAAVQGSSITFIGVTATKWNVESFNLGTIAP